ncbi:MAG TPA: glycoside hydrolase family 20 zincin-like fold domain-containing protein [Candidatus Hydrogenedentes bacterium]|nr:glycoside hydrolase family 20 zincin-like fold domain-containing protein [Candidatus Hydrogenedentota bacterium]
MNRIVTRLSLPGIVLAAVVLHGYATREPESAPEPEPEVMLEPLEETEPEPALPERALPPLETLVLLPAPQQLRYEPGQYAPDTLEPDIELRPPAIPREQGYILSITPERILITARDLQGIFYAEQTLNQLKRQFAGTGKLPVVHIEDWPDFPNRGVMLDVARDKVPTMETLYLLVDMFASLKFNQLQLYTEHTFAYPGHEEVWKDASPMTAEEIQALDAYCAKRFIELVPNQNSFGHMHRWLEHDRYKGLAETPGSPDLCPTNPASIDLLRSMYDSLLPNFTSRQFNVGCDETFSLGKGGSKEC